MATNRTTRLTDRRCQTAKPGKHGDGGGLSLVVGKSGSKSWTVRIAGPDGKRRDRGIGSYPKVSLAAARRIAREMHDQADAGMMPQPPTPEAVAAATAPTLAEAADAALARRLGKWRESNRAKAADEWRARLRNHAADLLPMPVTEVTRFHVREVVERASASTPVTARLLRGQLREIFSHALFDFPGVENPAGECLDRVIVAPTRETRRRRALPYGDVGAALAAVDAGDSGDAVKLCLRLLTLTAVRSAEARELRMAEVDFDAEVWTIPAERMKSGKTHRVPLSRQAIDTLRKAEALPTDDLGRVFRSPHNRGSGQVIKGQTLRLALDTAGVDCSPHGMRTSFRQWAFEHAPDAYQAAELALAHTPGNQVAAAYIRDADLLDQRRPLMQEWADFVTAP